MFRPIAFLSQCPGNREHKRRGLELFSRWQFLGAGFAALARETKTPGIF